MRIYLKIDMTKVLLTTNQQNMTASKTLITLFFAMSSKLMSHLKTYPTEKSLQALVGSALKLVSISVSDGIGLSQSFITVKAPAF